MAKFTEEDMEEVVEPLRHVMRAFASALCTTIDYAVSGNVQTTTVIQKWVDLGDQVCEFMKEED